MHYHKEQTKNMPIAPGPEPDQVVLPLSQHIGAVCEPLVEVGAEVKVGQKIAEAKAFISAPIHASVSGKVTAIIERPHPAGAAVKAIVIENDKQYTSDDSIKPYKPLDDLSPKEIVDIVKEAGLVGLGGATFPTYVKLLPPEGKKVDTVILNGAECEPFLSADHRVMLERTEDILYGAKAIAKALSVEKVYIAIEDNKPDAIRKMKETIDDPMFSVVTLKTKYPQGAEKVLVKAVLNRKVPSIGIPLDVGVVVCNVGTAAQIGSTLKTGMPLVERVVTIAGHKAEKPGNYLVKLGTPIKLLFPNIKQDLEAANKNGQENDQKQPPFKVVAGGPMMGVAQWTLDVPVIKGTSGVITLGAYFLEESACIRCGRCINACPFNLMPLFDADDSCMECGSCAYACPAKRHLVQRIKLAKLARRNKK
ncbi:MAG: electron transport complex subunit RsxC [Candidatus Margulisiibacteriota bacterium]